MLANSLSLYTPADHHLPSIEEETEAEDQLEEEQYRGIGVEEDEEAFRYRIQ